MTKSIERGAAYLDSLQSAAPLEPKGQTTEPTHTEHQTPTSDKEKIAHLASLTPFEYDRAREGEAKAMGIRTSTLDKLIKEARRETVQMAGIDFDEVQPWPEAVDTGLLLTEIADTLKRFIICPKETIHAAALWVAMTWLMDVVQIAPLAVITAPEKRSGKSQLLFLLGRLAYRPLTASNITPAALFRTIDAWNPTLLVDEADAFMKDNEELRGLINCGHTRDSAYIIRVVGDDHTPTRFNVWGAKAIAGIGRLADTLMDRSIVLELRRKLPHEEVERLRHAEDGLFETQASKLARFAEDQRHALRNSRPDLPEALNDRAQDNWEPLLAIADLAGGEWPKQARHAALKISGGDTDGGSFGNELLADIREMFEASGLKRTSTADLIKRLCDDEEKPWATHNRGKPISPRQVANMLKEYGITSRGIRIGLGTPKGFEREWFEDAFARYLTVPPGNSATPQQPSNGKGFSVADNQACCGNAETSATPKALPEGGCGAVADNSGTVQGQDIIEAEV